MVMLFPYNITSTVRFVLIGSGTAAFSTAGSGSLLGTNILISKDGAAFASSTNTGTVIGSGLYELVVTSSECSAKAVLIIIAKGTLGTIVENQALYLHTYGNVSAMYPFDFGTALASQTVGTVSFVATGTITQVGTVTTVLGGTTVTR